MPRATASVAAMKSLRYMGGGAAALAVAAALRRRTARATRNVRQAAAGTTAAAPPQERIDGLVKENNVMVFSKTSCPYCAQAKAALKADGVEFSTLELDELSPVDCSALQDALQDLTGARTVPRVFIKGQCIGGCDDTLRMQADGTLAEKLGITATPKKGGKIKKSFKLDRTVDEWFETLNADEFRILRMSGTEAPGSHEYDKFLPETGHFACKGCGIPLYSADSKFKSSCGWPVFDKCYYSEDAGGSHVGVRKEFGGLEIICNRCESHLGHVFFDAYSPSNPNGERH